MVGFRQHFTSQTAKFEYDDRSGSKAEVIQIQRGQTVDYDNIAHLTLTPSPCDPWYAVSQYMQSCTDHVGFLCYKQKMTSDCRNHTWNAKLPGRKEWCTPLGAPSWQQVFHFATSLQTLSCMSRRPEAKQPIVQSWSCWITSHTVYLALSEEYLAVTSLS